METRECTIQDVETVVDLATAMLQEMTSHDRRSLSEEDHVRRQLRTRFLGSLEGEDHVYILGTTEEPNGEVVGMAEARLTTPPTIFRPASILHVHALYVPPRHRHQGIGQQLLEMALAWGRARGCSEAELSVAANNPARTLYERVGFEVSELEMRMEL